MATPCKATARSPGRALETSLAVEFQVEVIKGKPLDQIWFEDAEDVMVLGVDNSLDLALQGGHRRARTLASRSTTVWNDSEVASLLGAAIRYDIAEVVDPRPHVVARISKAVLAKLAHEP